MTRSMSSSNRCSPGSRHARSEHPSGTNVPGTMSALPRLARMALGSNAPSVTHEGLLRIEDCLDADGRILLPPGVTLISLIDRNIANVGDSAAYRYIDYTGQTKAESSNSRGSNSASDSGHRSAFATIAYRGDRVAVLAPQGLDYVAGFFAAIKAGAIAVALFAPELQGHAERLEVALRDARPSVVLTTSAAAENVTHVPIRARQRKRAARRRRSTRSRTPPVRVRTH